MSGFDSTYQGFFGDRWPSLKAALLRPNRHVAWQNPFAKDLSLPLDARPLENLAGCWEHTQGFPAPEPGPDGLLPYYLLDAASVWAARALDVQPQDRVLDLCAAPGGKSLVLAERLGSTGEWVANERSAQRRRRLHDVLRAYLPQEVLARGKVTGHDATRWGLYQQNVYDRVLLDAPCSGERHILHDPVEERKWSPQRSKRLAQQQFAMLCAALEALKPGGVLVYSTCALSPLENDQVVERFLTRRAGRVELWPLAFPVGERTDLGWRIWPDQTGWGPIYVAGLRKPPGQE